MKRLMIWVGPVTSAKSTGALGVAHRLTSQGHKVLLVRPRCSVRGYEGPGAFSTKDGMGWASIDVETPDDIHKAVADHPKVDTIWIDEPALFREERTPGLPPWLFDVVCELRRRYQILISGIAATSEMDVFGKSMPLLMAVADDIIQCRGECSWCSVEQLGNATRSVYLGDAPKTGQALVGGLETYLPACPSCWTELARLKSPSDRRARLRPCVSD